MKEQLIFSILQHLNSFNSAQLAEVKQALYIVLCKYEIEEKQTSLQLIDRSSYYYLNLYCESLIQSGKSEGTANNYKFHISKLLSYLNKNLSDITEDDIFLYLAMYKKQRSITNGYLNNIRIVFNGFFKWLVKRKIIMIDPMYSIDPIKYEQTIKKPYSPEEMEQLRSSCTSERDISIVDCLYSTAVRISELARLNRSDISFSDNEIIVYGKGKKERITYLNAKSILHLKRYLASRTDQNEALFVSEKSPFQRLSKNGLESLISRIGNAAKVQKVHPHRFRRTSATDLLNAGMPIEQVQELLGHSSIETTRHYCTVSKQSVKHNHQRLMNF